MLGFGKLPMEMVVPLAPAACVAMLEEAEWRPLFPTVVEEMDSSDGTAGGAGHRLEVRARRGSRSVTVVLRAVMLPHPAGCVIRGDYRLGLWDKIRMVVNLAVLGMVVGGPALLVFHGVLFAPRTTGGEPPLWVAFLWPAVLAGFLFFLNHLTKIDPAPIERYLKGTFRIP